REHETSIHWPRKEEAQMGALRNHLRRFASEESGQDIIEYALMIVLVALVVAGAVPSISGAVSQVFSKAISALGGLAWLGEMEGGAMVRIALAQICEGVLKPLGISSLRTSLIGHFGDVRPGQGRSPQ